MASNMNILLAMTLNFLCSSMESYLSKRYRYVLKVQISIMIFLEYKIIL